MSVLWATSRKPLTATTRHLWPLLSNRWWIPSVPWMRRLLCKFKIFCFWREVKSPDNRLSRPSRQRDWDCKIINYYKTFQPQASSFKPQPQTDLGVETVSLLIIIIEFQWMKNWNLKLWTYSDLQFAVRSVQCLQVFRIISSHSGMVASQTFSTFALVPFKMRRPDPFSSSLNWTSNFQLSNLNLNIWNLKFEDHFGQDRTGLDWENAAAKS